MTVCVEVCTILTEVFLAAYLFERMFTRTKPFFTVIAYYILYGIAIAVGTFWIPIVAVRIGILMLLSFIGNFIVYAPNIFFGIYITCFYYISVLLSDLISGVVLSIQDIAINATASSTERLVHYTMAKLINLLLLQLTLLIFRRNKVKYLPYAGIPLLVCQALSACVCYFCYLSLASGNDGDVFWITALCLLVINIVICVFINLLQQYYEDKNQAIAAEKQKEIQLQYYRDKLAHQEETRAIWHDIKKYFIAMKAMVEADHSSEAEACFHELQVKFDQVNQSVDVGNPIIDTILSHALNYAKDSSVKLESDVWIGPEFHISPADLFIIIGNTLDNAIEACTALPPEDRCVRVVLRQTNQLLYYEVSNPYATNHEPKPGRIHGYGLKNVRSCIEKNQGVLDISTESGTFSVKIILNV